LTNSNSHSIVSNSNLFYLQLVGLGLLGSRMVIVWLGTEQCPVLIPF